MTDNEKRAHDLAVAICIDSAHIKAKAQINQGSDEVQIDYFAEYITAYEAALDAMNQHFLAGK